MENLTNILTAFEKEFNTAVESLRPEVLDPQRAIAYYYPNSECIGAYWMYKDSNIIRVAMYSAEERKVIITVNIISSNTNVTNKHYMYAISERELERYVGNISNLKEPNVYGAFKSFFQTFEIIYGFEYLDLR